MLAKENKKAHVNCLLVDFGFTQKFCWLAALQKASAVDFLFLSNDSNYCTQRGRLIGTSQSSGAAADDYQIILL